MQNYGKFFWCIYEIFKALNQVNMQNYGKNFGHTSEIFEPLNQANMQILRHRLKNQKSPYVPRIFKNKTSQL